MVLRGGGGSFGSFGRLLRVTGDDRDVKGVVVVVVVVAVVVVVVVVVGDVVSVVADDVSVLEDVAAALDDGDGGHGVRPIRIAFENLRSLSLLRGQIIPTARRAGRPKDVFLTLLAHGKKVDQRQTKVASKGNTFFFLDGKNTFLQLVEFASFIHMKSITLSCCAARLWKSRPLDTLGY